MDIPTPPGIVVINECCHPLLGTVSAVAAARTSPVVRPTRRRARKRMARETTAAHITPAATFPHGLRHSQLVTGTVTVGFGLLPEHEVLMSVTRNEVHPSLVALCDQIDAVIRTFPVGVGTTKTQMVVDALARIETGHHCCDENTANDYAALTGSRDLDEIGGVAAMVAAAVTIIAADKDGTEPVAVACHALTNAHKHTPDLSS
ncbi:hypothetical protein DVS28_b0617 (plasmid) [Euzebya pacifica]|uniref:Uncharacterized protein n=1 Tax=Euzebya pacifica TaxID=1608957 RepID=A0A346Y7B0_9ACTN|nr:hypothetical protein [Euzebya pacifica]AXV10357.1 hypothetical protein DVS28_b0617 [Euzebya pacifica]